MNLRFFYFFTFFVLFGVVIANAQEPVLLRIGTKEIRCAEFEYYYQSKKGVENLLLFSPEDILEDFISLQLKVLAAEEAGLNNNGMVVQQLEKFRNRLSDEIFLRKEELQPVEQVIPFYQVETFFYPVIQHIGNREENRITQYVDSVYRLLIKEEQPFQDLLPESDLYRVRTDQLYENEMMEEVESVISALKVGEYSQPFRTAAGWYIIRLLYMGNEQRPVSLPRYNDPAVMKLVEQMKREYNYKEHKEITSALRTGKKVSGILFTLNDYAIHSGEFLSFADNYPGGFRKQYDAFVTKILFRHRYELLISADSSWEEAFKLYYNELLADCLVTDWMKEQQKDPETNFEVYKNKNFYKYNAPEPVFRGIVVETVSKSLFRHIKKITKKNPPEEWEQIINEMFNRDDVELVKVQSGEFAEGENAYTDHFIFKVSGAPVGQGKYNYGRVYGKRTFREKRPEDTTEDKLMEYYLKDMFLRQKDILRSRYKVELFQDVLKTVNYN